MPNKPGYYEEWYEKNKGAVADRRKERYEKDPEYRVKVLERSSAYREERRKIPRVRVPRSRRGRVFEVDGKRATLYSIGGFATWVNRSIQSLNHWESSGILPKTPYRVGKRGFRFYSKDMIEAVREIVGDKKRLFPVDDSMGKEIREKWESLGVPVDCEGGMEEALRNTKPPTIEEDSD